MGVPWRSLGNLVPGEPLRAPAANIDHYRVVPTPDPATDPEAYWVLDQIEELVCAHRHPIVNLSLGPAVCVEPDGEPSRWTNTLDRLAYEEGTLFVIAAGNNGLQDHATALDRVQAPADMANGLSVGACTAHAPEADWERTPYSAIGPGRTGSKVQPTGVQFGGTTGNLFQALMPDGTIAEADGTSFAAPLVTHSLIRLCRELGPSRANANALRAISVHLAEVPLGDGDGLGHGQVPAALRLRPRMQGERGDPPLPGCLGTNGRDLPAVPSSVRHRLGKMADRVDARVDGPDRALPADRVHPGHDRARVSTS